MKIFILEDNDTRIKLFKKWFAHLDTTVVSTAKEAIDLLHDNEYDVIFLDHDLDGQVFVKSDNYNTGYTVAKEITNTKNKRTKTIVHSHNPDGAMKMIECLKYNDAEYMPFGSFDGSIVNSLKNE